jgi:hypothetical protein
MSKYQLIAANTVHVWWDMKEDLIHHEIRFDHRVSKDTIDLDRKALHHIKL